MVIWTIIAEGDVIMLNEFVYLYRLKESKEFGYYELVPWVRRSRLIVDLPSSFRSWKSRYFFVSGDSWKTLFNDFWRDVPRLLRQWETLQLDVFASYVTHIFFNLLLTLIIPSDLVYFSVLQLNSILSWKVGLRSVFGKLLST